MKALITVIVPLKKGDLKSLTLKALKAHYEAVSRVREAIKTTDSLTHGGGGKLSLDTTPLTITTCIYTDKSVSIRWNTKHGFKYVKGTLTKYKNLLATELIERL